MFPSGILRVLGQSFIVAATVLTSATGSALAANPAGSAAVLTSENFYSPDQLLEIEITLPPEEWRTLRTQHRNWTQRTAGPRRKPYTYFKADVRINGTDVGSVGVRKKGWLGSAVSTRPSLKLKFDEFVDGQEFLGIGNVTLNNNNQDPTRLNTFATYNLFRAAGLPASRVNFAHVTVNGEDLGVYSNVEPIKKPFLKRHFGSSKGNLYENPKDFERAQFRRFQRKNNEDILNRDELIRAAAVMDLDDEGFLEQIDEVLDLDSFLTFWAPEVLVGHWDGYASNMNNTYLYHHPDDGRFRFIPWGADDVFADPGPFITQKVPVSVKARNQLTARLYSIPATRDRYLARVRELLNTVWNESRMIAEMDEAARLFEEHLVIDRDFFSARLEQNKSFILNRRAAIEAELSLGPPVWPAAELERERNRTLRATFEFDTTWSNRLPDRADGQGSLSGSLTIDGRSVDLTRRGMICGWVPDGFRSGHPFLVLAGYDIEEKRWLAVTLIVDPFAYEVGKPIPVDFFTVLGMLMEFPGESEELGFGRIDTNSKSLGWGIGQLELKQAGTNQGDPISGSFDVRFKIK